MKHRFFHVKSLLATLLMFVSSFAFSQGTISMKDVTVNYSLPADTELQNLLSQSADYKKLSSNDQQAVYYLNYARRNPQVFLTKAINVFVAGHPEVKSSYIGSLQSTFKNLQPLSIVMPDAAISKISLSHAADLRSHNFISHSSSNGQSFQDRLGSVLKGCGSEAIHASYRYNPLEAILMLLFDFNVPDLGHRKSLLSTRFAKAGFGSSTATNAFSVLVIDFSCQ
jgi:uncharacterized protein YkwD